MTRGERRVGAEGRGDLEDLAEAGDLRHLLEELRRLREVGRLVAEVLEREQLGVGLGCRGHELRRVHLDVVALDPVRAEGVLEGRLHAEDEVVAALAEVEEAPVHALVHAAVGGDGRLGESGGRDVERADLDLDAAELHALVVLQLTRDRQEGARGEVRDEVGEGQGRGILFATRPRRGRVAGLTSCTAPVSSRRMTNCTFFWSRTVSTHPETETGPSARPLSWLTRTRSVTSDKSTSRPGPARPQPRATPCGIRGLAPRNDSPAPPSVEESSPSGHGRRHPRAHPQIWNPE